MFKFFLDIIVITGALIMAFFNFNPYNDKKFDREKWLSSETESGSDVIRTAMAEDLIDNHIKQGMTATEVEYLLGVPDTKLENPEKYFYTTSSFEEGEKVYAYSLGLVFPYGYDDTFVFIYFDKLGKVKYAEIGGS